MATLRQIRSSNAKIGSTLPAQLVAVFAGATSGIGESSLKQFAKNTVRPRVYFIGRSVESGQRVTAELQKINSEGEYNFISADVSLLCSVDDVCREIRQKETAINLLFLTTGTMVGGKDTEEGLYYPLAVAYFARLRFIVNLLPLLQNATALRRVVSVLAGTKEGLVDTNDLQGRHLNMLSPRGRGHFSSMMTLGLEAIARKAPTVTFLHSFPGFVKTNFGNDVPGVGMAVMRGIFDAVFPLVGPFIATPFDEAGERQLYLATSARFGQDGVPMSEGVKAAKKADGGSGGFTYSVSNDGETAPLRTVNLLAKLRQDGTAGKIWENVEAEFVRITGAVSI
ncbi:hypothetical protein QBC47DRAFT_353825 [Echria macrotheca]|uniref:Short-chain dehydrogenase/reductase n=1 Tax=Echria macrotheca TaxID=438768 RepID=A0AAJ0B643_9PEZI|nr:hypothetical protein QBC47DRAFT_353825 [Echria macrotheca]